MPATYLPHQLPVLGLKMWRPTWFDGTALVLGSIAPDWAYVLDGSRFSFDAHLLLGVLLFCTPVSALGAVLVRPLMPAFAAHVRVPDLAAVASSRPSRIVTLSSALLGALTHIGWDAFTHSNRWAGRHFAWFREVHWHLVGRGVTGAGLLQLISTVLGGLGTLALFVVIRRRGLLTRWSPPVDLPARWRGFWVAPLVGFLLGSGWATGTANHAAAVNRAVLSALVGVALSCLVVRQRGRG